jgi:hypothetical protein
VGQLKTNNTILRIIGRKLGVLTLLTVSAVAFATLGDGKVKSTKTTSKSLLSNKSQARTTSISLRSGYNFRGGHVISTKEQTYINLTTTLSLQKGHTTYVLPMKKKVLDRVTFNPNQATRQ